MYKHCFQRVSVPIHGFLKNTTKFFVASFLLEGRHNGVTNSRNIPPKNALVSSEAEDVFADFLAHSFRELWPITTLRHDRALCCEP